MPPCQASRNLDLLKTKRDHEDGPRWLLRFHIESQLDLFLNESFLVDGAMREADDHNIAGPHRSANLRLPFLPAYQVFLI